MLSTIVLAVVYAGLLLGMAVLWGLFLRLGLRFVKAPGVTPRSVIGATALVIVLQMGLNVLLVVALRRFEAPLSVLDLLNIAAQVILACVIINAAFKTGYRKAFLAWLPTLFASIILVAVNLLVVRPYIVESFFMPTNAMAPTLIGSHWRGICPECGQSRYCSPRNPRRGPFELPLMICENFHVTQEGNFDRRVLSGDRFLVAKFLEPRRWDIVAFRYPGRPSALYAMRLVGLPGETIRIHDGSVWADGERLTPPESLRGIKYLSDLPGFPLELWGSPENPATLAEDEYFVLGDFSARSYDSRTWMRGAPGYHPYAVPESYVIGVVTHTFWPPRRWRIHR